VQINDHAALRVDDTGTHSSCCGPGTWKAVAGSKSVFINDKAAHRKGDKDKHCGGDGKLIEGSPDVEIGDVKTHKSRFKTFNKADLAGLGMVAADIIKAGVTGFQHGFKHGIASLLGAVIGDGILGGLGFALGRIPYVGELLEGAFFSLVKAFHWDEVAHWFFSQLIERLLNGWDLTPANHCPENVAPFEPVLSPAQRTFDAAKEENWARIPPCTDVTRGVGDLLYSFRPVFVENREDQRAVTLDALLEAGSYLEPLPRGVTEQPRSLSEYRAVLEHYPPRSAWLSGVLDELKDVLKKAGICESGIVRQPREALLSGETSVPVVGRDSNDETSDPLSIPNLEDAVLVIPEDVARGLTSIDGGRSSYYGRALKMGPDAIFLHYFAMRPGSFLGSAVVDQDFFEHSADAEEVMVVLRRKGEGTPWELSGLMLESDHVKASCCTKGAIEGPDPPLPVRSRGGRPVVYVATGSHAIAPEPGMRSGHWGFPDYYDSEEDGRIVDDYDLVPSTAPDVRLSVFTKQVTWGVEYMKIFAPSHGKRYFPEARLSGKTLT
jgi:hypothetical protein